MATTTKGTRKGKASSGFTPEERAAMRERARELKAEGQKADGARDVLAKIAEMPAPDRAIAERLHAADVLRAQGAARRVRGQDPRPREEGGELTDAGPAEIRRPPPQRSVERVRRAGSGAGRVRCPAARGSARVPGHRGRRGGSPRPPRDADRRRRTTLFLFMEPTSPKGDDIVRRGMYALHCLVPDAH